MGRSKAIAVAVIVFCVAGCVHTRGGGAAASRPVCFSVSEVAFIRRQISKCKGQVERYKLERQRDRLDAQRDTAILKGELDACAKKTRALLQRRCPTCALPWVLVGVVSAAAGAALAWALYREVTR